MHVALGENDAAYTNFSPTELTHYMCTCTKHFSLTDQEHGTVPESSRKTQWSSKGPILSGVHTKSAEVGGRCRRGDMRETYQGLYST